MPRILNLAQGAIHSIIRRFACAAVLVCTPQPRREQIPMDPSRKTSTSAGGREFLQRPPPLCILCDSRACAVLPLAADAPAGPLIIDVCKQAEVGRISQCC